MPKLETHDADGRRGDALPDPGQHPPRDDDDLAIGVEGGGKRLGVLPVQCHEGIDDRLGGLGPFPTGNEQFAGREPTVLD